MVHESPTCVVWKAVHINTGRHVFVKKFRKRASFHALREINQLVRLDHPHIIPLVDIVTERGGVSLITPHMPSSMDLFLFSSTRKGMSEDVLRLIFRQILSALVYMKVCFSMTHGDISPENIVIVPFSMKAMLIDFGNSECIPKDRRDAEWVCCLHGKEGYMPPERWCHAPENPFASDVWSLAVCMVNAATNQCLYEKPDPMYDEGFRSFCRRGLHLPRHYSKLARDVLGSKMLRLDLHERTTLEQLLIEPWVSCTKVRY